MRMLYLLKVILKAFLNNNITIITINVCNESGSNNLKRIKAIIPFTISNIKFSI